MPTITLPDGNKLNFPKSKNIELINIGNKIHFDPGKPTKFSGSASLKYILVKPS